MPAGPFHHPATVLTYLASQLGTQIVRKHLITWVREKQLLQFFIPRYITIIELRSV